MQVRATQIGYYAHGDNPSDHQLKFPAEYSHKKQAGVPFTLHRLQDFSPTWMEIVDATEEERVEVDRLVEARKGKTEVARKNTITMNSFGAPPSAPGVKIKADVVTPKKAKKAAKNSEVKPVEEEI